jgi:hypothetical protein
MTLFTGHSATETIKIATVVMPDSVLTGRERRGVSDDVAGLKKVLLTMNIGETQDSASTDRDDVIVDDEAKYKIG